MLLDIGLPGMSGLEVLAKARRIPTPPRVVMMTADDTPETLLQSFRGQAHLFVRKPFAPKRIVDMVNEVLASSPAAALPIEVVSARPGVGGAGGAVLARSGGTGAGLRDAARREAAR